jgi:hypothetical protein
MGLGSLVAAIRELAAAIDRYRESPSQDAEQTEQLRILNETNAKAMAQRASWELVEREHMKVCARRYEQLRDGESMDDPPRQMVKH